MKTYYKQYAKHGSLEHTHSQDINIERNNGIFEGIIRKYGLIIERITLSKLANDWEVSKYSNSEVKVKPGSAILKDSNGFIHKISNDSEQIVSIPTDDNITYKLAISYTASNYEDGTVTINNGSTTVTGTGTKFTQIFGANRRIIINDKAYIIESVQNDTQMTLADAFPDTSVTDAKFKVGAWFTNYPVGIDDNLIYEYNAFNFVIKSGELSDTEYLLAEITVAGNIVYLVEDKRKDSILELFEEKTVENNKYNLIRNGNFNTIGSIYPFRSNSATAETIYGENEDSKSCKISTGGYGAYHWLGQKIYLNRILRRSTKFSLALEVIADYQANIGDLEISVYAWDRDNEKSYQEISDSNGLTLSSNRVLFKDKTAIGNIPVSFTSSDSYKSFVDFEVPSGTSIIYFQIRLNDNGSNPVKLHFDNIQLVEGGECPSWRPNPEDLIEERDIGLAAYIVNQLFELSADGKIMLKASIYGKNGDNPTAEKILDAIKANANTTEQTTSGTTDTVNNYIPYDDSGDKILAQP